MRGIEVRPIFLATELLKLVHGSSEPWMTMLLASVPTHADVVYLLSGSR